MNYIHAENSIVIEHPYSIEKMRSDNPQTSFPIEMGAEELAEWGVFAVEEESAPAFNEQTESIELQPPALVNGVWVQGWLIAQASAEEIDRRTSLKADLIRKRRNQLLTNSDPSQLSDFPGTAEEKSLFTQIRQQLRDIPQQPGFPWTVVWPGVSEEGT